MDLEAIAKERRLRTLRLEDGELVIPLRGAKKTRYPSANPHAGVWGADKWYVMLPTKQPGATADRATAFDWCLEYQLADDAVLIFGRPHSIIALIMNGPKGFRAKTKRGAPRHLAEAGKSSRFAGSASKSAPISAPHRRKVNGPAA